MVDTYRLAYKFEFGLLPIADVCIVWFSLSHIRFPPHETYRMISRINSVKLLITGRVYVVMYTMMMHTMPIHQVLWW